MAKLKLFKERFDKLKPEEFAKICQCGQEANGGSSLVFDTDSECYKKLFGGHEPKSTMKTIVHGAVGITKAVLNLDPVKQEHVMQRLAICRSCPFWSDNFGGQCQKCKCLTWAKVKNKSESCPDGRW
jgi:hypothetical protein